jgi:hypothetical protein
MSASPPEVWLRGPVPGVAPELQPAAHAILQTLEDVERTVPSLTAAQLWATPGGAASAGFHVMHLAGSMDRLLTYARGEGLSDEQRADLLKERDPGTPPPDGDALLARCRNVVTKALEQLRATPASQLAEPRSVGRARLPSTVGGLLFHAAEHGQRHAGQLITTARIVRGLGL